MPNIQCYSSLPQLFAHERNNHIIRVIPIILPIIDSVIQEYEDALLFP